VDCLGDDLAVLDDIGINPVSNPDLGVCLSPLEKGNPLVCSNVGVLERSMLWQLLGEHPGKLPYTLVATKNATVDEDDNVEVIIEHLPRRSTAQVVHEKAPLWLTPPSGTELPAGRSTRTDSARLATRSAGTGVTHLRASH
jgi:hypothetical protein